MFRWLSFDEVTALTWNTPTPIATPATKKVFSLTKSLKAALQPVLKTTPVIGHVLSSYGLYGLSQHAAGGFDSLPLTIQSSGALTPQHFSYKWMIFILRLNWFHSLIWMANKRLHILLFAEDPMTYKMPDFVWIRRVYRQVSCQWNLQSVPCVSMLSRW